LQPVATIGVDRLKSQMTGAQFYIDLATGPFYGYNRPGAKKSQAVIDNWWRQGMMPTTEAPSINADLLEFLKS
jgi:hypothetical protein